MFSIRINSPGGPVRDLESLIKAAQRPIAVEPDAIWFHGERVTLTQLFVATRHPTRLTPNAIGQRRRPPPNRAGYDNITIVRGADGWECGGDILADLALVSQRALADNARAPLQFVRLGPASVMLYRLLLLGRSLIKPWPFVVLTRSDAEQAKIWGLLL